MWSSEGLYCYLQFLYVLYFVESDWPSWCCKVPKNPIHRFKKVLISSSLCLFLGIFLTYFCPRPSACKNVFINSINSGTFSSLFDFNQSEQSTMLVELSQPAAAWLTDFFRQHSMRIEVSFKTLQLTARSVVDKRCQNLEDRFAPVFSRWWRLNWPYILKIRLTDWKGYNQRLCRRTILFPTVISFLCSKNERSCLDHTLISKEKKKNYLHLIPRCPFVTKFWPTGTEMDIKMQLSTWLLIFIMSLIHSLNVLAVATATVSSG